jgi:IS66 Orf2 like protein
LPSGARVWLACGYTDMRKGMDGLAMLAQQVVAENPFSGALFAFRGKRGQRPTFCIQFALCHDCLPMAPAGRSNSASIALSPRQGPDVHLYR